MELTTGEKDIADFEFKLEQYLNETNSIATSYSHRVQKHELTPQLFEDQFAVVNLDLDLLRRIPRLLIDSIIKSRANPVLFDNYMYWGWTAAAITHSGYLSTERYSETLNSFLGMINLALTNARFSHLSMLDINLRTNEAYNPEELPNVLRAWNTILRYHPGLSTISTSSMEYLSKISFPVLDGLLARRCRNVSDKTGELDDRVASPWHPEREYISGRMGYHSLIKNWQHHFAADNTREALAKIDDLTRYDDEDILNTFVDVESIYWTEANSTNHFLRIFEEQRNSLIHGNKYTRGISVVGVNLCCMAFWDLIKPDQAQDLLNKTLFEIIRNLNPDPFRGRRASYYFPVINKIE